MEKKDQELVKQGSGIETCGVAKEQGYGRKKSVVYLSRVDLTKCFKEAIKICASYRIKVTIRGVNLLGIYD